LTSAILGGEHVARLRQNETWSSHVDAVPITHAQKFIFQVFTQMGPRPRWLQLAACVRVSGPVDVARFERAAAGLVTRYPILRSRLELSGGEVLQREDGPEPSVEVADVAEHTDREVDAVLSSCADEPLDLFQGRTFRVVLARRRPGEGFLMLVGHHMFLDLPCMQTLLAEYLDLLCTDPVQLTPAPWSNGDRGYLGFARLEQKMIRDGTFSRRAQYWQGYLDRANPALQLPDRPADPVTQSWVPIPFSLRRESFRAFSDRAKRLRVTRFALIAASLFQALRETTGQSDLSMSVVSNIRRPPFERTVGQFAEMIILSQRAGGPGDDAIRVLGADIIKGMRSYVPSPYLDDRIDWLRKRRARGYSMTDVDVNYLPVAAQPGRLTPRPAAARPPSGPVDQPSSAAAARPPSGTPGLAAANGFLVSQFLLTAQQDDAVPYYGVVLSWLVRPGANALSGLLRYEPGLVAPQLAHAMVSAFVNALSGGTGTAPAGTEVPDRAQVQG
jgi:hypothetical protein